MMGLVGRFTEVNRGQEGKDKCLQERHKEFEAVHENHEGRGEDANAVPGSHRLSAFAEDENQAHKRQDDDVTRADVGRQSDHQHDGLQEHSHDLDGDDDGHHKQRHTWRPEQVAPVMLVSIEGGDQEHQRRQHHGDAQGACHVEASNEWNKAQQVGEEDEFRPKNCTSGRNRHAAEKMGLPQP